MPVLPDDGLKSISSTLHSDTLGRSATHVRACAGRPLTARAQAEAASQRLMRPSWGVAQGLGEAARGPTTPWGRNSVPVPRARRKVRLHGILSGAACPGGVRRRRETGWGLGSAKPVVPHLQPCLSKPGNRSGPDAAPPTWLPPRRIENLLVGSAGAGKAPQQGSWADRHDRRGVSPPGHPEEAANGLGGPPAGAHWSTNRIVAHRAARSAAAPGVQTAAP